MGMTFGRLKNQLMLTAFAISASTGMSYAQGVAVGADKATYVEALKDIEPIVLQSQTAGGPGGVTAVYMEDYAKALEEWSGGKVKLDIAYGSAIQRGENSPAIADGRLFFAAVIPMYKPSEFPKNAAFATMMFDPGHSPLVSVLQYNAAATDAAAKTPELFAEYEAEGIRLALGGFPGLPMTLFCSEQRDTADKLKGAVVRTSSKAHAAQVAALGMSSMSMPYGEIFEGLQRGVVDCALTHSMVYTLAGLNQVAPFASLADKASFAGGNSGVAFDMTAVDELPLAVRQLVIDRLDVYYEGQVRGYLREAIKAHKAIADAGGQHTFFDEASEKKVAMSAAKLVETARETGPFEDNGAVVDRVNDMQDKWYNILSDLGYVAQDKGWENVTDWLDPETIDLKPYVAKVYEEAILPLRPTE
jgi:TRAP-type C4-dicarboxylate transport system substrate-binding protein